MGLLRRRRALYVQYGNPAAYPPVQHGSRLLAKAGWEVLVLGTGALGDADRLDFPPEPGRRLRRLGFQGPGWRQKIHYLAFCLWAFGWLVRFRPRWIYASDPLSCPPAALFRLLPGLRLLYHEHDSPEGVGPTLWARLVLAARRRVARRAELYVLPNEERARWFQRDTGRRREVKVVWNCPERDEIPEPREPDGDGFWLVFSGTLVPDRLPPAVIEALALLPKAVRLRVIGYETIGHPGYVGHLRSLAERLGVEDRLHVVGAVPRRAELLGWVQRSHLGLAFMPGEGDVNMRNMTGASNKPFDYLACGRPFLVSDLPDWRAAFVDTGHARACDPADPASIAGAVRWMLEHPAEAAAMGETGRERVRTEWNYERQFAPVLAEMGGR